MIARDNSVASVKRKSCLPDAWQVFRHRQPDTNVEPLKNYFRGITLKRLKETDEEQPDEHDQGEGHDHDRLDGVGKGIGQLLHGERNDRRENADRDGVRDENGEDSIFEAKQEPKLGEIGPEVAACRSFA